MNTSEVKRHRNSNTKTRQQGLFVEMMYLACVCPILRQGQIWSPKCLDGEIVKKSLNGKNLQETDVKFMFMG